nr:MAG TPA: hypothetical protein [Caudoviricetes sp.]
MHFTLCVCISGGISRDEIWGVVSCWLLLVHAGLLEMVG